LSFFSLRLHPPVNNTAFLKLPSRRRGWPCDVLGLRLVKLLEALCGLPVLDCKGQIREAAFFPLVSTKRSHRAVGAALHIVGAVGVMQALHIRCWKQKPVWALQEWWYS